MNNLKQLLKRPLSKVSTGHVVAVLIIALLGFADAAFLTIEHYRGVVPPCSVTEGCDVVLGSQFSSLFGIPTALFGAIYYLLIVLGAFIFLESKHVGESLASHHFSILKWCLLGTIIGFLMSLWFIYLQVFILHSYCAYCLGSALTSIILFIIAIDVIRKNENI
ncbi:MAG: vitamin K epoxide reductase family protein [Candidatus Taylorbacteria bacterium]|nr:vitamin K epoxide reductase family protein [Candidatus Taylorbacteria bacterium]